MDSETLLTIQGAELVLALALMAVLVALLLFGLLRAGKYPPAISLVIALSLLSLVSLATFALTREEVLGAIAATGIGALAGAVSAVWREHRNGGPPDSTNPPAA